MRGRLARALGASLVALALSACESGPGPVACEFGASHLVATAVGGAFDGLALAANDEGLALVWSDEAGLHRARLDGHGARVGEPLVLGARCTAGLDAVATRRGAVVACAMREDADHGRAGRVLVSRLGREGAARLAELAPVGPASRGVAIAADGDTIAVGWRDEGTLRATAYLAELRGGRVDEPAPISSRGTLASAPSLAYFGGDLHVAWTESWFDRAGRAGGHLLVRAGGEPPMPSLEVSDVDARVRLTADGHGPMVALRDVRPAGARARMFAGRLDARRRLLLDDLRSPGRADAEDAHPSLVPCGGHVFAIATRRSSREVTMVTLRRLDAETLRPLETEHQIYEYHARFPQAVGACVEGRLLVAVGERASQVSTTPRLRTYELACGPGRPHARTPTIDGREHDLLE